MQWINFNDWYFCLILYNKNNNGKQNIKETKYIMLSWCVYLYNFFSVVLFVWIAVIKKNTKYIHTNILTYIHLQLNKYFYNTKKRKYIVKIKTRNINTNNNKNIIIPYNSYVHRTTLTMDRMQSPRVKSKCHSMNHHHLHRHTNSVAFYLCIFHVRVSTYVYIQTNIYIRGIPINKISELFIQKILTHILMIFIIKVMIYQYTFTKFLWFSFFLKGHSKLDIQQMYVYVN